MIGSLPRDDKNSRKIHFHKDKILTFETNIVTFIISFFFITDFKSSSPTSNESKNSTEKEQQLDKKETQNSFKSKIDLFENISQNQ